ncbi:MAG: hypothetical protein ACJ8EY_07775 [Sphingomicrobium sp.]
MLISPEVRDALQGPFVSKDHERRIGRLHSDLETFVTGQRISIAMNRQDDRNAYLRRLEPADQATWTIRSREAKPALRVLGRFAAPDVFVALTWRPRSVKLPWSDYDPLTDELSWRLAIQDTVEKWHVALPDGIAAAGEEIGRYVTDNVIRV